MALPTPEKTWQHKVNVAPGDQGGILANRRRVLRRLKDILINAVSEGPPGFTTPWTVVGSSDSVAAGIDAVDRWDSDSDLVWANAGSAHSWMLLRQTGIQSNFQMLISCSGTSATGQVLTVSFSPSAGYTGGSITADPTATDSVPLLANAGWMSGGTGYSAGVDVFVLDVQISSDGQCTRVVILRQNVPVALLIFDRPKNPTTGWTNPCVGAWVSVGTAYANLITYANLFEGNAPLTTMFSGRFPGAVGGLSLSSEGGTSQQLGELFTTPNDVDGAYPMMPVAFYSTTASARGRHGQLFDMWCGLANNAVGDTYPADGSKQFVQFGALIFKWNGSVPVIA